MSRHSRAVERAVAAAGVGLGEVEAPLVELCRSLAAQMDASDGTPSTRLSAAYLSALKDVRRAVADAGSARAAPSASGAVGRVARLRAVHGGER